MPRRRFLASTAASVAAPAWLVAGPRRTAAQTAAAAPSATWPTRPLRLVAGGAGGVTDVRARWLADRLGPALGQPVIVDNVPAAGGVVSAEQVARAAPDGHTLLLLHQGIAAFAPHLYGRVGYDPIADFTPVARLGVGSLLLVVPQASPVRSAAELVARARAAPAALNYGTPGNGTPPHVATEHFKRLAGIDATHVPFKGGGAMLAALLGAQIDFAIEGLGTLLPHVRSGRLRALGISGARRLALLPDVPTLAETVAPGYEFVGWTGIAVAAATPAPIVERLHREISRIADGDEGRRWFDEQGAEPGTVSPAAFGAFIRAEHARWGQLIRDAKLRAE